MSKDYLDPKQNPMIKIRPDDFFPVMDYDDPRLGLPFEEPRAPLGDYRPKKTATAAESSPAADADNTSGFASDLNRITDFMKGRARYPVHSAQDDFLYDIVRDGDNLLIENASGERRQIKAGEVGAINKAISREILRRKPDDESTDNLEQDISALMPKVDGGSYEITIEDGTPTPLFNIIRTADGNLEVKTSEDEVKSFSDLTLLERKLVQHDFRTRKEFWNRRKE